MKLIVATLAFLVLTVSIVYFTNKPARTGADMPGEATTRWTPRQIAKDPEGYLYHNDRRAEEMLTQLQAALISTSQLTEQMIAAQIESTTNRDALAPILNRLRESYKSTRDSASWPAIVNGRPLGETELRKAIVDAHSRLDEQTARVVFATEQISVLESRAALIRTQISDIEQLKLKIGSDLELVRTQGVRGEVEAIQIDISTFERVSGVIAGIDAADPVKQMLIDQASLASDHEFESILAEDSLP